MNKKDTNLDDILVKRNLKTLTFGLQVYVFSNKIYGSKDFYTNPANLCNVLCVIDTYKGRYFSDSQNDVSADLLLGVKTRIYSDEVNFREYEGYFTYKVYFKVEKGIRNFKIISLERGNTMRECYGINLLNAKLIPNVDYKNFDDLAEAFLDSFYPDAITNPIKINVTKLLNTMKLDLKTGWLDGNYKGLIAFDKGDVNTIDEDDIIEVQSGTVVVNNNIAGLDKIGVYNNTIVHECVHWWLHKKYMELRSVLGKEAASIICPTEDLLDNISDEDLKTIEFQARALAPLILMPKETSIMKFESLIIKYSAFGDFSQSIFEQALEEFAMYFGVTKASARNRLEKLGYNESLKKDINIKVKKRNITRFINYWDYCKLENDTRLAKLIENKFVIYADGFIVPNFPDYVFFDEQNRPKLTETALANIMSIAMPIKVEWSTVKSIDEKYLMHSLCDSGSVTKQVTMNVDSIEMILNFYKRQDKNKPKVKEFFRKFRYDDTDEVDYKYSEYLNIMMDRHKISNRKLAVKSGLSKATIDKYKSYTECAYSESVTLRLCIGMNAYPYETLNLLKLRGTDIENSKTSRSKYLLELIENHYDKDLNFWKDYLKDKDPAAI